MTAYLDIETSFAGEVTVVGIYRPDRGFVQLVAPNISQATVAQALDGCGTVYTWWGDTFDLPVLRQQTGLDIFGSHSTVDLCDIAKRRGIRGGLKRVEETFDVHRESGPHTDARLLWQRWSDGDPAALDELLTYNRDDVMNLVVVERRLRGDLDTNLVHNLHG